MKKLMVSLAAVLFAASLMGQERNFLDQPYLEVNGRAEMEVVPDEIYLRIVITEKDNKGKVSVEQQEKEMFKQLKDVGINLEQDLAVQDMGTDLQSFFLRKDAILTTKVFQLKVNSATQLGKVFQALQKAAISDVNITKTDVSNIEELRQQVRTQAAKAAQKNAEVLAEAVGQKVGSAIFIQDYGYSPRPFANVMMAKSSGAMMDSAGNESAPNLEFEKIKIEHSVLIRFILKL